MTEPLPNALARVEQGLTRLGRDELRHRFRAGLRPEEVRSRLASVGIASSPELEALYGWHDGTETSQAVLDDIHMFPGFYLLTLDDALAGYLAFVDDPRWPQGLLPVLANGGGDFYAVDTAGPTTGQVRHFRIDEPEQPVEFSSVSALFATLAAGFDTGVFFVDPAGYLEMNDLDFGAAASRVDPEVSWWNY